MITCTPQIGYDCQYRAGDRDETSRGVDAGCRMHDAGRGKWAWGYLEVPTYLPNLPRSVAEHGIRQDSERRVPQEVPTTPGCHDSRLTTSSWVLTYLNLLPIQLKVNLKLSFARKLGPSLASRHDPSTEIGAAGRALIRWPGVRSRYCRWSRATPSTSWSRIASTGVRVRSQESKTSISLLRSRPLQHKLRHPRIDLATLGFSGPCL